MNIKLIIQIKRVKNLYKKNFNNCLDYFEETYLNRFNINYWNYYDNINNIT